MSIDGKYCLAISGFIPTFNINLSIGSFPKLIKIAKLFNEPFLY